MIDKFKKQNPNLNGASFYWSNTQCNIGAYKEGIKQDQDRLIFPFTCSNVTVCGVADGHGGKWDFISMLIRKF